MWLESGRVRWSSKRLPYPAVKADSTTHHKEAEAVPSSSC